MTDWNIPRPDRFARRRHRHIDGSIRYDDPRSMRSVRYEDAGTVDGPFDRDDRNPDAADEGPTCAVPWVHAGYVAVEVYVDPRLADRAHDACEAVNAAAGTTKDVDGLTDSAFRALETLDLDPSLYEAPPDGLSSNVLAIGVTAR
jgi:hypothetical protein